MPRPTRPAPDAPPPVDALADLRLTEPARGVADTTPPPPGGSPPDDGTEVLLEVGVFDAAWHQDAIAAVVRRWHADPVAYRRLHVAGRACACPLLARLALLEAVGLQDLPTDDQDEGGDSGNPD